MASSGRTALAVNEKKLAQAAWRDGPTGLVDGQLGLGVGGQRVVRSQPFGDMPGQAGLQAFGREHSRQSATSACGDSASSRRSSASIACSESRWLLTDTYSPEAIASASGQQAR